MKQYQDRILDSLKTKGSRFFKELIVGLQPIDIVRTFIAILYLGMSDIIDVKQIEEIDDIKLVLKSA